MGDAEPPSDGNGTLIKSVGALPDFMVIGGQKCGTTFLYQSLLQHPRVLGAHEREVSFFTTESRFGGPDAYRQHFPLREELPEGAVVGEKSPGYFNGPNVAARAASVVPWAKPILLLRNPVDRAYSNYQHRVRHGEESLSFEEAIEAEPNRLAEPSRGSRRFGYLHRSRYIDHLPAWHEHFGDRLLVLHSEKVYEHPRWALKQVCDCLGVDWKPDYFKLRKNKSKLVNRNAGLYDEPMKPETRRYLEEYFEPYNQELFRYLGRDFGW